jgi:class 3 adenylate cyclase
VSKLNSQKWINSKEVLNKCGISRATLNNYIKLGIIPKPLVKTPDENLRSTKKIGYFPETVLGIIEEVKRLKGKGESMEKIAGKVKALPAREYDIKAEKRNAVSPGRRERIIKEEIEADDDGLRLTLEDINTPAYLLNYQFEIEWINEYAEEKIFGKTIRTIKDVELRNIFRLFLNWEFSNFIENWEEFLDSHMIFFKSKLQREHIVHLYTDISEKEIDYFQETYDKVEKVHLEKIHQQSVAIAEKNKAKEHYVVYTTFFREGMFFLYLPADNVPEGIAEFLSKREIVVRDLLQQRLPTLVSFSVLVADLQSSVRICAELPPEEYFELINGMWKILEESFKKFNGIFGKRIGDGIVYYFLKKQDPNYIMNSISCALEIREKMRRFSSEWKVRKKWHNDLFLNIGINEGQEYFSTTTPSSANVEFTALGDTINYASRLSNLARYGSIITTKNLMNKLNDEYRKTLRFGIMKKIHERDVFVEKVFSRIIDLVKDDETGRQRFVDIAALPVTEIMD